MVSTSFPAERSAAPPFLLLVVDCKSWRYTLEGPMDRLEVWYDEVNRAVLTGRQIFCIPVSGIPTKEIALLGTQLGYDLWPAKTIVAPASQGTNEILFSKPLAVMEREFDQRFSMAQRQARFDWLNGLRNLAHRKPPESQTKFARRRIPQIGVDI